MTRNKTAEIVGKEIEALVGAAKSSVRASAAASLGQRNDPAAREALLAALDDDVEVVRSAAFEALSRSQEPSFLRALLRVFEEEGASLLKRRRREPTDAEKRAQEKRLWRVEHLLRLFGAKKLNEATSMLGRLYHSSLLLASEAGEALLSMATPEALALLWREIESKIPWRSELAVEAALSLPARDCYERLSLYLDVKSLLHPRKKRIASLILERLAGPQAAERRARYQRHLREEPRWFARCLSFLRAGLQANQRADYMAFPRQFLESLHRALPAKDFYERLSPYFDGAVLAKSQEARWIVSGACQIIYLELEECFVERRSLATASLLIEPRWIFRYLLAAEYGLSPAPLGETLKALDALPLSPSALYEIFSPYLLQEDNRTIAREILEALYPHATLCTDPRWEELLQGLAPSYPLASSLLVASKEKKQEAFDPLVSAEFLERAARSMDKATRLFVAQNPNAPFPLLFSLAEEFPKEVLQNPLLPLLFLEDPLFLTRFLASLPPTEYIAPLRAMLSVEEAPPWLLELVVKGNVSLDLRKEALRHPNVPLSLLEKLADINETNAHVYISLRAEAIKHPRFPAKRLDALLTCQEPLLRWAASKHPAAPRERIKALERLGATWDHSEYKPEKVDPSVEPSLLQELSNSGPFARLLVSKHPNASKELLRRLSQDDQRLIRQSVAENPSCPKEALSALAKDPSIEVRINVAKHPRTRGEVLSSLSSDQVAVQEAVAAHPNTPKEDLTRLGKARHGSIRSGAAANPSTPKEVLCALAYDHERTVRLALSENPNLPEEAFWVLAKDTELEVRISLAAHPKAPGKVLGLLAQDPESRVKRQVVQNESAPREVLALFAKEKRRELREAAARHPNASPTPTKPKKPTR